MLDPRAPEHEIAIAAQVCVGQVRAHLAALDSRTGWTGAVSPMVRAQTVQELNGTLNGLAYQLQARPVAGEITLAGRVGRMLDPLWWSRNLRRELLRENEAIEHAQGRVRRKGQVYVSDHAMARTRARAKANRATLEGLEVVNEDGHACNLLEVADASVSNPKLRRSELMVRCRGFEETAKYMGHEAVFLTITCPSRFHRFNAQGKPNEKWHGETPKDAQKYINGVWAKIRAEWKRRGYAPYGFRVAEPHHDGCPHWHVLLFVPPQQVGWFVPRRVVGGRADSGHGVVGVAGQYAMADSPGEPGAIKHRFTCKKIDPASGSATGYIAKYISKNIDGLTEAGEGMGLDFASGKKANESAPRVRTWASTWGIRQFQQIGGPSVTVWREMRRLGKDLSEPLTLELFEHPRSAADRALWSLFWVLQGGPEVPRSQLTLKPKYTTDGTGKYGDDVRRVHGVTGLDADAGQVYDLVTRMHTWTVQGAGLAAVNAEQAEWTFHVDVRRRFPEFVDVMESASASRDEVAPWTGVNNCTADDEAAAVRNDFLRGQGGLTGEVTHASSSIGHCDQGKPPPPRPGGHC